MSLKNADKFAVIDIGSNTIRGVLYSGGVKPSAKETITFQSHILADTKEGVLTVEGIFTLCESLLKIKKGFLDIERVYAFATSAMRDVKNFDEVYSAVKDKTGIEIDLVSGEREAEYDCLALKSIVKKGIGVDLGGGSAQVVCFDENGVKESLSMPIGVKRVRNMFCKAITPTADEKEKIENYIREEMSSIKGRSENIIFMGGTAKAVVRAAKKLLNKGSITPEVIDELYKLTADNEKLLKNLFKERFATMPAGFIVMKCICENLGGKNITVTDVGVRDGYVVCITGD